MLVRRALAERAVVSRMAPALVRPTRFLVPLYAGGRVGPFKLRLGLQAYDWLAAGRGLAPCAWHGARAALALEPEIEPHDLLGAGAYSDAVVDDARLCVAVARDAALHGAAIHTYTEVVGARPGPAEGSPPAPTIEIIAREVLGGGERSFLARVVVNATGPWADGVRRLLWRALRPGTPEPDPILGPSRGIPLVYPPIALTSGVRPLVRSESGAGSASREHRLVEDGRVMTLVGGKYTTFRLMAREALERVAQRLGRAGRPVEDADAVLPRPLEPPPGPAALAEFAVREEFARRLEDVVRRRTHLWLELDRGRAAAAAMLPVMARLLEWSPERARGEMQAYEASLREEESLLERGRTERSGGVPFAGIARVQGER